MGDRGLCPSLCMCFLRRSECTPPSSALFLHQFMMQFLFRVMKYTWLLPPERTDAKNTCGRTQASGDISRSSCCQCCSDRSCLIVSLAEELQPLGSFVHEDAIKVAGLHRSDFNGLLSPSHDLIGADVSCGRNIILGMCKSQ